MEDEVSNVLSTLRLSHCVFDDLHFRRLGFPGTSSPKDDQFQFSRHINKDADGAYRVTLSAHVERENEFDLVMSITGYFEIDEQDQNKDTLLEKNAVAILFPFLRAELSLMTAQPEMMPVVLPAINITAMFDEARKKKDEAE